MQNRQEKPYVTGPYGCSCHPFNDWDECNRVHRQKYKVGDKVKNRCNLWKGKRYKEAIIGTVIKDVEDGYYIVKYGPNRSDECLIHAANIRPA